MSDLSEEDVDVMKSFMTISTTLRNIDERLAKLERKENIYTPPSVVPTFESFKPHFQNWNSMRARIRKDRLIRSGRFIGPLEESK